MWNSQGRTSSAKRIKLTHLADQEIKRFQHDSVKWIKHVANIELDPLQILRIQLMNKHPFTIAWDARRMRKTTTIFLHALHHLCTRPFEEFLAVTPRVDQAQKAMQEYMTTVIRRSPILQNYIGYQDGKKMLADGSFMLANQSKAWVAGIMAEVDGAGITYAVLDELEDLNYERLTTKVLPMLGQAQKLGSTQKARPQVRASGVIKGSGIRKEFLDRGFFPITQPDYPHGKIIGDVHVGIALGILNEEWIKKQATLMSPNDYTRQMLCREIETDSVILEKWVRRAMQTGDAINQRGGTGWGTIATPMPNAEYKKRGIVAFGYDHLGHGDTKTSSRSALVVAELVGEHVFFPFVKSWNSWEDETAIMHDLVALWRYFKPDEALGDALGVGMLTALNDRLYQEHLTQIDRRLIGEGKSTATTWTEWAFSPIRFQGEVKHKMAQSMRFLFQQSFAVIPYFDDKDLNEDSDPVILDFKRFTNQLTNVIAEPTKTNAYPSYVSDDRKVGDDFFDAAMAATWALTTRGYQAESFILLGTPKKTSTFQGFSHSFW